MRPIQEGKETPSLKDQLVWVLTGNLGWGRGCSDTNQRHPTPVCQGKQLLQCSRQGIWASQLLANSLDETPAGFPGHLLVITATDTCACSIQKEKAELGSVAGWGVGCELERGY